MVTVTQAKKARKRVTEAGFDGAKITQAEVRVTASRKTKRTIRARPGSFEWAYGRKTAHTALFHAGSHFSQLWEQAGTADARSPDYEGARGGGWKGLPDKRCDALSELNDVMSKLGSAPTSRLIQYCVHGKTSSEIARAYGTNEREMAHVLKQDLRDCALHFRFLSVHGRYQQE